MNFCQHKVDHLTLNIRTMNFKCLPITLQKKEQVNGIGQNMPGYSPGTNGGIVQDVSLK